MGHAEVAQIDDSVGLFLLHRPHEGRDPLDAVGHHVLMDVGDDPEADPTVGGRVGPQQPQSRRDAHRAGGGQETAAVERDHDGPSGNRNVAGPPGFHSGLLAHTPVGSFFRLFTGLNHGIVP
jgi:hypothetical protein